MGVVAVDDVSVDIMVLLSIMFVPIVSFNSGVFDDEIAYTGIAVIRNDMSNMNTILLWNSLFVNLLIIEFCLLPFIFIFLSMSCAHKGCCVRRNKFIYHVSV